MNFCSFARLLLAAAPLFFLTIPAIARAAEPSDFYYEVERAIQSRDPEKFLSLASANSRSQTELKEFFHNFLNFPSDRIVMKLADERPELMLLHVLQQTKDEALFESWRLKTREEESKRVIDSAETISSVDGLYQLRLGGLAIPVHNLTIDHFDASIQMESGHIFVISAGGKPAGIIFVGKGTFAFSPREAKEKQQLSLFCKEERLQTRLDHFYLRASTNTLRTFFGDLVFSTGEAQERAYERAQAVMRNSDQNAFGIRLPFSEELWFPRLLGADLYTEMKTRAGNLIYQFAPKEVEDVLLLDKDKERIISLYSSSGDYESLPQSNDFKILSYKMKITFNPTSNHLSAVSEVTLQTQEVSSSIIFKMNPDLRVSRIEGSQGSLIYFQEKSTNNLHVVMNDVLEEGSEIALQFFYQGRLEPDRGRAEVQLTGSKPETDYYLPPTFLYSNASQWYPQLASRPYSPVEISITVPAEYAAISNGELKNIEQDENKWTYSYLCDQPVKYFSLLVGRISSNITHSSIVPMNIFFYSIDRTKAEEQAVNLDKLLRYYQDYFGKYPYTSLNMALRPWGEPGGHAPATFVISNRVFTFNQTRFARDPLYMPEFPDFILAHEVAHQWWGQAVGWRHYRDQWLSEGFAHFAAAEYIRTEYGNEAWLKLSRAFFNWIELKTKAGPLILGSRLGHLTNDPHAFSALLYNKGAYVLIMLKNWMGDENFSKCLSDFFQSFQHRKAGIEDFKAIVQRHSEREVTGFFNQWLNRWDIPDVKAFWELQGSDKESILKLKFEQSTAAPYQLLIPVVARGSDGRTFQSNVFIENDVSKTELRLPFSPESIEIDPFRQNLMKLSVKGSKR